MKKYLFASLLFLASLFAVVSPASATTARGSLTYACTPEAQTGNGAVNGSSAYAACTFAVRVHSTQALATIYSDNVGTGTAMANPYTASAGVTKVTFYADDGQYDVTISNSSSTPVLRPTVNAGALILAGSPVTGSIVTTVDATAALGTVRGFWSDAYTTFAGTLTSGSLTALRGTTTIAAGTTAGSGAFIFGTQGKIIIPATGVEDGADVAGVFAQLDVSAGTVTSGIISALWADWGATAATASPSGTYLIRATNTTNMTLQDAIHIYAKATNAFSFENNGSAMIDATGHGSTAAGRIRISVNGETRYLHVFSD